MNSKVEKKHAKTKVLLINQFFRFGSTGKNVESFFNYLISFGYSVHAIYGWKKQSNTPEGVYYYGSYFEHAFHMLMGNIFGLQGSFSNISTSLIIRHIKKFSPTVVCLSNLHGYYLNEARLLKFLKKRNIWVLYGMPDEYAFMGKCFNSVDCQRYKTICQHCPRLRSYPPSYIFDNSKRIFMKKAKIYDGFNKIVFRSSPYIISKARESKLIKHHILCEVGSSVDLSVYYPREETPTSFKYEKYKDRIILVNAAQYSEPLKGVEFFYKAAKKLDDRFLFINVGCALDPKQIEELTTSNFIFIDYISDKEEMAKLYSVADSYVCTSIADGMPNTCLEALACGTPVIGFDTSGVPYVADNKCGTFVKKCDVDELSKAINKLNKTNHDMRMYCREYAVERFDKSKANEKKRQLVDLLSDYDDPKYVRSILEHNIKRNDLVQWRK